MAAEFGATSGGPPLARFSDAVRILVDEPLFTVIFHIDSLAFARYVAMYFFALA